METIFKIIVITIYLFPYFLHANEYAIKLNKINKGVWIFNPSYNQYKNKIVISNIGIIEGDNYTMVIDTGNSKSFALRFLAELKKVTKKPIKYLVITHRHFDHTFGIEAYINQVTEIFMDKYEFEMLKSEGPLIKNMIMKNTNENWQGIEFANIINLKINHVKHEKILDLGNRKVLLKNIGRAHTNGDIIIYDFKSRTYFAGDLVFQGRAAAFSDANVRLWSKKLENVFNRPWNYMLPGHGKLITKKKQINETKLWLKFINNSIEKSSIQGDMISEVLEYPFPEKLKKTKLKEVTFKRGLKKQIELYKEKNYIE
tara:strand:- start:558 stop:1499 length:942 start_codon:yes stop_codon:yes gene_type:complete